jgi:hypothetical protein
MHEQLQHRHTQAYGIWWLHVLQGQVKGAAGAYTGASPTCWLCCRRLLPLQLSTQVCHHVVQHAATQPPHQRLQRLWRRGPRRQRLFKCHQCGTRLLLLVVMAAYMVPEGYSMVAAAV